MTSSLLERRRSGRRGQPAGADEEEVILGVDIHQDTQVASVITAGGVVVASQAFPATAAGYSAP